MPSTEWQNVRFLRFEKSIPSSTSVAEVVLQSGDDRLKAYIKAMGNPAGPHALVCEWVGSQLAAWFGLSTLDFGIMQIEENDEIPLAGGSYAQPGPAFASKKELGEPWSGSKRALRSLVNPEDITRLVIFDTWILNADRCPPAGMRRLPKCDNVFLSDRDGIARKHRLLAMDHTHCVTGGREITTRLASIERIKDVGIYGLFLEFTPFFAAELVKRAVEKIQGVSSTLLEEIADSVPPEWSVSQNALKALRGLLLDRASFLAEGVYDRVLPYCRMHDGELFGEGGKNDGGK